jgi:hypothetical protein
MARKQIVHRSMRGKVVDMDLLRKKNELVPAIGNAKVNARGDELGPGGKIKRKREDIVKDHYQKYAKDERGQLVKTKTSTTPVDDIAESLTETELEMLDEYEEEWLEDEDGNFTKKGD